MSIERFSISNDPSLYEAWPDVVLTGNGTLVCVFSECSHHVDRSYTRIVVKRSGDRGRTWSEKIAVTEGTSGLPYFYNCARIVELSDGRLVITVDRLKSLQQEDDPSGSYVVLYYSADDGVTWSDAAVTPLLGIVPGRMLELESGRLIISAHHKEDGRLAQFLRYSDDGGVTWSGRITVAKSPELNLCEVSMVYCGDNTIVALMRENSGLGYDCKKVISRDNGESWGPIIDLPLPGCHRPSAGFLQDGRVMVTYRFLQGGRSGWGQVTQNFFAAVLERESLLAEERAYSWARIMPVDYDRSPHADLGYSGWVQFPDGEIYIVQYIVDDAWDKGQIRGYAMRPEEFMLTEKTQ